MKLFAFCAIAIVWLDTSPVHQVLVSTTPVIVPTGQHPVDDGWVDACGRVLGSRAGATEFA